MERTKRRNSEKFIEKELAKFIKAQGGICRKYVSPGHRGVPDRLCFLPNGKVYLVETKSLGDKPSMLQIEEHKNLRALGFSVVVIDSEDLLDSFKNLIIQERLNGLYKILPHPKTNPWNE